jgi:phage-related protein (TIGR01555 family)
MNMEHRYWGLSEIQFVYDKIRDFGSITGSVVNIIMEFLIGKFTLDGLKEMLAEGNEQAVVSRMEIIAMCKSVINSVLLGQDEKFERDAASVTGIPDIMDRFMMIISGVTGTPVTKLFGRSAAGMDATGENDVSNYYDTIRSKQKTELKPALRKLISMICAWKKIAVPPQVKFNPLQQMDPKEEATIEQLQANTAKLKAEADAVYITNGVLQPGRLCAGLRR